MIISGFPQPNIYDRQFVKKALETSGLLAAEQYALSDFKKSSRQTQTRGKLGDDLSYKDLKSFFTEISTNDIPAAHLAVLLWQLGHRLQQHNNANADVLIVQENKSDHTYTVLKTSEAPNKQSRMWKSAVEYSLTRQQVNDALKKTVTLYRNQPEFSRHSVTSQKNISKYSAKTSTRAV